MKQVRLGDLLEVQAGFAFKTEFFTTWDGVPLIRIRDLAKSKTEINYCGPYKPDFLVNKGDYLIGMDGNFRCYRWQGIPSLLNQRVCRVRNFREDIEPGYIYYGIQRKLQDIEDATSFVTVKHLSATQVQNIEMALPPLPEQRRIVDLLSRAEGIVRLRREAEKKAAELIPALFIDMFGDPAMNPKGWPIAKVGALLVEPPTLGTMAKPSNNIGQWLDLRVANIQGGQLTLVDKKWLDLPDSQVSRFALQSGDVVLARAIGSLDHLGKAVVLYPDAKWTFDSHLMRLRFDKAQLLPQVFKAFLESNSGRSVFLKHTRRSAVQFNINGKEIREISIPVPPMALQQSFWQRSQELQSIQSQQSTATAKAQATFDALLARFFAPTTALNSGSSD